MTCYKGACAVCLTSYTAEAISFVHGRACPPELRCPVCQAPAKAPARQDEESEDKSSEEEDESDDDDEDEV